MASQTTVGHRENGHVTLLALTFQPNIELASTVRRFVSEIYARVFGDPDVTSRIALATHELIENSVKYASTDESSVCVEFEQSTGVLRVTTSNEATAAHRAALEQLIENMSKVADPEAFYDQLVIETAMRDEGSGLGLGRIRAEADMRIGVETDGKRVHVCAATTITRGMRNGVT